MRDSAIAWATMLAAACVPAIAVRFVARSALDQARDVWLFGLAWIGAALTLALVSVPLGLMAIAVVSRWRSWEQLPAVATWAGIIATWALVQHLPPDMLEWLPLGWRVITAGLIAFALAQRWHGFEVKATTGSRVLLAGLLVLVWPFTSPPEWPAYAAGFWLTSSWIALAALLVAIALRYPVLGPSLLGLGVVVVILFAIPWTRRALIDRTPRGGSLDGLRMRWRTWAAMVRVSCHWPIWLIGWGPNPASRTGPCLERALAREAVRMSDDRPDATYLLATDPTHCEPLELACTYGLLAVLAMGWLAWQLMTHVNFGNAWSASAVAGVVLACATIPARAAPVGLVWLLVLAVLLGR